MKLPATKKCPKVLIHCEMYFCPFLALFLNVYMKSLRFVFVMKNLLIDVNKCFTDFREI